MNDETGDRPTGAPPEVLAASRDPSARVGRYVILGSLGRGGMGAVYRAWDPVLSRVVALKVLLDPDGDVVARERFVREATETSRLDHPGIVKVHDGGTHQDKPFLVMELIDGESFHALLKRQTLEPRELARIVREVALAVAYAHDAGIVHRDLKPGNVLIDKKGGAHLADFGLVRRGGATSLTQTGHALGTPGYMAPEQFAGEKHKQGPHSDVYSLGAMLYRGLTGGAPYQDLGLAQILRRPPTPPLDRNPKADPFLSALAVKCLAVEPEGRPTASFVALELGRFLGVGAAPKGGRPSGRRLLLLVLVFLALLGSGGAAAYLLSRRKPAATIAKAPPPPPPPAAVVVTPPRPKKPAGLRAPVLEALYAIGPTGHLDLVTAAPAPGEKPRGSALALDPVGHRLFAALSKESRVFVYKLDASNAILERDPLAVIGQPDFESTAHGRHDTGFAEVPALAFDAENDHLYVLDLGRNRALVFDTHDLPRAGAQARYLLGKISANGRYNWDEEGSNWGNVGLRDPFGITVHGGFVYTSATTHMRVNVVAVSDVLRGMKTGLEYMPRAHLGRVDPRAPALPTSARSIEAPWGLAAGPVSGGEWLFVADQKTDRVLGHPIPVSEWSPPAAVVLGKPDFETGRIAGATTTRGSLRGPEDLALDAKRGLLYVADVGNHRVVAYDVHDLSRSAPYEAAFVLGQPDFTTGERETCSMDGLGSPRALAVDPESGRLFVGDALTGAIATFMPAR